MKELRLTPVDWFYFKNHALTTAGNVNENVMDVLFPPRPNTIYGALRSGYIHAHSSFDHFYEESDEHIKEWMGTKTEKGNFAMQCLLLKKKNDELLPVQLDFQV